MSASSFHLGFNHKIRRDGSVDIFHRGRRATTLRGELAAEFREDIEGMSDGAAQQWMARLTGNYKRGNERLAKKHPRNRH